MNTLRGLPSVDELFRNLRHTYALPPELVKDEIRLLLSERRKTLQNGDETDLTSLAADIEARLALLVQPSLRRVINATGTVLHTNLGRAPLPALTTLEGYSNLEYDLATGTRRRRDDHLSPLLSRLLGRPGIVVNNNAAAVYLLLHELARGGEVIISRGELIEIGDGFRIPEILARSGAILREVGTTNKTRVEDYASAITERTRLILRVHPSNFHLSGFTSRPKVQDLVKVATEHGIPVAEDLGSGCLLDLQRHSIAEPVVQDSLRAGVDLVCFSGDKLLGGPQAGIIAGHPDLVERLRRNPMYRAFRVDKLIIQALESTLLHVLHKDWNQVPALRMIQAPLPEIRARAERIAAKLPGLEMQICSSTSLIGGGATPDQSLPTWVLQLAVSDPADFQRRLRAASTPVIARIVDDCIVLDVRTISDNEEPLLIASLLEVNC